MEIISLMFMPLHELYALLDKCENLQEHKVVSKAINQRERIFHRGENIAQ